jgi:hypothetical protein
VDCVAGIAGAGRFTCVKYIQSKNPTHSAKTASDIASNLQCG